MKFFLLQIFITAVLVFNFKSGQAQISNDFAPLIEQIPTPPQSCKEASEYVSGDYDSEKSLPKIDSLEYFFNDMYNKLLSKSESIKKNFKNRVGEEGRGRGNGNGIFPGGIPQGDMKDVMSDFRKADNLQVKIDEAEEKFRNELESEQNLINTEIKKTLATDIEDRFKIVDKFLKNVSAIYFNFTFQLNQDFKELDEIMQKYDYGENKDRPLLKKKAVDIQLLEVKNLRLLLSCTKGSIMIGSRFYTNKN